MILDPIPAGTLIGLYFVLLFVTPTAVVRRLLMVGWLVGVLIFLTGDRAMRMTAIEFGILLIPVVGILTLLASTNTRLPGDILWEVLHSQLSTSAHGPRGAAQPVQNQEHADEEQAIRDDEDGPVDEEIPTPEHPREPWPREDLFTNPESGREETP